MVTVIMAFCQVVCEIKGMYGIVECKISPYSTLKSAIKSFNHRSLELDGYSEIDNTMLLHHKLLFSPFQPPSIQPPSESSLLVIPLFDQN